MRSWLFFSLGARRSRSNDRSGVEPVMSSGGAGSQRRVRFLPPTLSCLGVVAQGCRSPGWINLGMSGGHDCEWSPDLLEQWPTEE